MWETDSHMTNAKNVTYYCTLEHNLAIAIKYKNPTAFTFLLLIISITEKKLRMLSNRYEDVCVLTHFSLVWLWDRMYCSPPGSSFHGMLQRVGCHALLQGIFPTQGSNLCLLHFLHFRHIFYHWETWNVWKYLLQYWWEGVLAKETIRNRNNMETTQKWINWGSSVLQILCNI